jgi:citrate lyase subunit beta / citryl-CoA lyase
MFVTENKKKRLHSVCVPYRQNYQNISKSNRVTAVQFGAEDLTKELGIERTLQGKEIEHARNVIALAGNACKIDILDTPFTAVGHEEGLVEDTKQAKRIGFTGKACIHPNQIEAVNGVFTPDSEAVHKARELIHAFEEAVKSGKGACMFEGKMIDNPIADRARKLIEKAEFIERIS